MLSPVDMSYYGEVKVSSYASGQGNLISTEGYARVMFEATVKRIWAGDDRVSGDK